MSCVSTQAARFVARQNAASPRIARSVHDAAALRRPTAAIGTGRVTLILRRAIFPASCSVHRKIESSPESTLFRDVRGHAASSGTYPRILTAGPDPGQPRFDLAC